MKFGTDTGDYGKINGSLNIKFVICFHFQVIPLLSMPLTHNAIVTLYHNVATSYRDVIIVSYSNSYDGLYY